MPANNDVVIYIGGFELPDKNAAAHRVLNNAKLLQNKYQIVFIGVDKSLSYNYDVLSTKTTVQGFSSFSVPYPKSKSEWVDYLCNVKSYIKIIEKYNHVAAIIMYNFQAVAMKKLMRYCKKNKIKCLADVTEWRSAKGEHIAYRVLKDSDTWYRMNVLHKKMDGLIVISEYLQNFYSSIRNIVRIPTLTDLREEKWTNNYVKSNDCLYMVYAGNPGFKDKLGVLVEAIVKIKRNCHLDVIGITKEQYLLMNPQHLNILSNNTKIIFHGRLSHLEALSYVKKANYSCFFRENDRVTKAGFPTKFAEAISCGTPVLTNKSSDIEQYFSSEKNGVCLKTLKVDDIVDAIEKLPSTLAVSNKTFDYVSFSSEMEKLEI